MAILVIDIYRSLISSLLSNVLGSHCRFSPTCSCYSREAFKVYGFRKGLVLTFNRVLRCRPGGAYGHDPLK